MGWLTNVTAGLRRLTATDRKTKLEDDEIPPNGAPNFANFTTNIHLQKRCFLFLDGSLLSLLKLSLPIFFLFSGIILFAKAATNNLSEADPIDLIENGHWCTVYITVFSWDILMGTNSKRSQKMDGMVKSGLHIYEKYSDEDRAILNRANQEVKKMTRLFVIVFIIATVSSIIKSTVMAKTYDPYRHFYNAWFPFEVNTMFRVNAVRFYELSGALSASSGGFTYFAIFIAMNKNIVAHLEILIRKINRLLDPIDPSATKSYNAVVGKRIEECVKHHCAILELFNTFCDFSNFVLGISTIVSGFMLCTLGYLLTNPDADVAIILTFSGVVIPEMCSLVMFRINGQRITDLSREVNDTLYNLEWFERSEHVKKDILLWHLLTKKPLFMRSLGLRNVSHAGIGDILQTAYTYFNMLRARA